MKKAILYLCLLFVACTPGVDAPSTSSDPQISYDIAGQHYIYQGESTIQDGGIGVSATKAPGVEGLTNTFYQFSGYTGNSANFITFHIVTPHDTLKTVAYHLVHSTGFFGITVNHVACGFTDEASDYIDATITSYNNGVVNGYFSGRLTNTSTLEKVDVTNGLIKNVHLHY